MNDKTMNILQQYDMTVTRTYKGRGTTMCDTDKGMRVLKVYKGSTRKLILLDSLQRNVDNMLKTDLIVKNKEGGLFVKDTDGTTYILKEHIEGRECNYKNEEDVTDAFKAMAKLHKGLVYLPDSELKEADLADEDLSEPPVYFYYDDMEKHTRECRHVKNYLKRLRVKNEFEKLLLKEYDYFLDKAVEITECAGNQSREEYETFVRNNGLYCHGDFQYHNILFSKNTDGMSECSVAGVINFEHFIHDSGVRDFYLLFRKISEKSDWSAGLAERMLDAYQNIREFSKLEWKSLGLMLQYPEKFWKIINFYSNSRKSWIPVKNQEKLENLVRVEKNKEKLINSLFL